MPGNRFLDSVDIDGNETVRGNEIVTGLLSGTQAIFSNITAVSSMSATKIYGTLMDWMTLVRGYATVPVLSASITGGDVYTYTYISTPSNVTYYRYIATDGTQDAFYTYFSGSTLSGLVATKSITI